MKAKKWNIFVLIGTILLCILIAFPTIYYDPYFHYHAPYTSYGLSLERYQNNGIVKHFEYDALITGTSMTQNFKTSEFDEVFGVNSIKVPFEGGSYKEINSCVEKAVESNSDLKIVVRGLDLGKLDLDKDDMSYKAYPVYLYDENIFNDIEYVLNKETFLENTCYNWKLDINNAPSDTFDDYGYWGANQEFIYGKNAVVKKYERMAKKEVLYQLSESDEQRIIANIEQNVLSIARNNPRVTFYYFLTPYSIVWWDKIERQGKLEYTIETQKIVIQQLLTCDNIKLYSWCDNFDLIANLDNYKDMLHYSPDINSKMLYWMKNGEGLLTVKNYKEYLDRIEKYYTTYDYDALFVNEVDS